MSINEKASVVTVYNHTTNTVLPWKVKWSGRVYTLRLVDFHHLIRDDDTLYHIFGVTDGQIFFRLKLNTETLQWFLEEMSEGIYV